jgi:hypothetical protein
LQRLKNGRSQARVPSVPFKVRILPPFSGRLIRFHSLRPNSAKTHGNPARGTASRKTYDFLGGTHRSFNGDSEKRLRFRDCDEGNTLRIGADAMTAPFPDVAIEHGSLGPICLAVRSVTILQLAEFHRDVEPTKFSLFRSDLLTKWEFIVVISQISVSFPWSRIRSRRGRRIAPHQLMFGAIGETSD